MENINFDFAAMSGGADLFSEKKSYETDERFYVLEKDKDGNGAALIRFLPDGNMKANGQMGTLLQVTKMNVKSKYDSKRFFNELSPSTIGKKCPAQDMFSELWSKGDKENAKRYSRATRYYTNILVVNDPKKPENNGKVFLFDVSFSLGQKLQSILSPAPSEIALGAKPKQLFNPLAQGYDFKLVARKGANNITNYDSSGVADEPRAIFNDAQTAIDFIKKNCYDLDEFLKPESYKSYEELKAKIEEIDNYRPENKEVKTEVLTDFSANVATTVINEVSKTPTISTETPATIPTNADVPFDVTTTVGVTPNTTTSKPAAADDLDSLIAGLTK